MDQGDASGAEFDVFLSHSGRDKPTVEEIAEQLRREGLRPFLDSSELTPGEHWQLELARGLANSRTCALFVGSHPFGPWQLEELELALVWANRREDFRVFAVLLPGAEDPFDPQRLPPFLSTRTWVDLRATHSSRPALQRLLNAIKGIAQAPAPPRRDESDDVVPYRGLESFEEEHAELFFGREREVQRLLEILKTSPLLCVVGPSGSGKSSLVRAGLVPRLRGDALAAVSVRHLCLLRPGAHPLQALATQLAPLGARSSMQATLDGLATDRRSLHLAVSLALGADAPGDRVLIVVDQLEEVFTLCTDASEREQFFANLLHAAFASGGRTIVVLTMRADFYARCAEYPELAQSTARSLALIGSLDTDELRQAIEEPARRVGLQFESGLVQTILDDVGTESGALPLLEHALLEVWRRRVGDQLTLDGYVQAGRVEGALAQRAEDVFARFTAEQQGLVRRVLLRLTQPGDGSEDTRRRAARGELTPADGEENFKEVLDRLVDARLLTTGRDEIGREVVDVSHEALIRGWPRLRGWIDADRAGLLTHRRLTDVAYEWDRLERDPGALYRGARLAAAVEWAADHADELSAVERDFLAASRAAVEIEVEAARRRARRLRALAGALAALTAIVAVLAIWALGRSRDADRRAAEATSLALSSASTEQLGRRPDAALLLGLEAYRLLPRVEARSSLVAALGATRAMGVVGVLHGHTDRVTAVAFDPVAPLVATGGADSTIRFWDLRTNRQVGRELVGHSGGVFRIAFSPDGRTLASNGPDGTVRLWDTRRRRQLGSPLLTAKGDSFPGLRFAPDGQTLAAATGNTVRLWDVRTRRAIGRPLEDSSSDPFGDIAFSPDHRLLAAGSDSSIHFFDLRTHRQVGRQLTGFDGEILGLAFDRDGRRLASAGEDGKVRIWDVSHRTLITALSGHRGLATSVAFSPDGRELVSGGTDKTARVWRMAGDDPNPQTGPTNGQIGPSLVGQSDAIISVAFARDEPTLATASYDGTVWIRDLRARQPIESLIPYALAFAPDGHTLAAAGNSDALELFDARTRTRVHPPVDVGGGIVSALAFSSDGSLLAGAHEPFTGRSRIRLWRVRDLHEIGPPLPRGGSLTRLAFRPHTHELAIDADGKLLVTDALSGKTIGQPRPNAGTDLAYSPDGRTLASGGGDKTIRLWDASGLRRLRARLISPVKLDWIAFSSDGHTIAASGEDRLIRLWDVRTGKALGPALSGLTGTICCMAFLADGRTLVAGDDSGQIRLWDAVDHAPLGRPLDEHTEYLRDVVASPRAQIFASGSEDGTIRIWDHLLWKNRTTLAREICAMVGTGLSKAEWRQFGAGVDYRSSCP